MRRVFRLLVAQARYDRAGITEHVLIGLILLFANLFPLMALETVEAGIADPEPLFYRRIIQTALMIMLILTRGLARASLGDEALILTGITRVQWITFLFVSMLAVALKAWVCALPFLVMIWSSGTVPLSTLVLQEGLQFLCVLGGICLTLWSLTRPSVLKDGVYYCLFWLVGWLVPYILSFLAIEIATYRFGGELLRVLPKWIFNSVRTWGESHPFFWLAELPLEPERWSQLPTMLLINAGVYLVLLAAACQGALSVRGASRSLWRSHQTQRKSRRVWNDALAWQSWTLVGKGWTGLLLNWVAAFAICWWVYRNRDSLVPGAQRFVVLFPLLGLSRPYLWPALNFRREFKLRTMPLLVLTPLSIRQMNAGWRRGVWPFALADLMWMACGLWLIFQADRYGDAVSLVMVCLALALGPIIFVLMTMEFTLDSISGVVGILVLSFVVTPVCFLFPLGIWEMTFSYLITLPVLAVVGWLYNRLIMFLTLELLETRVEQMN